MKLISFEHQGRATYGAVVGNDVWDLGQALGAQAPDLKSLIAKNLQAAAAQVVSSQQSALKFDQLPPSKYGTRPQAPTGVSLQVLG